MNKGGKSRTDGAPLKNTDILVWRVMRDRRQAHDREITKLYNTRARERPETRH